MRKKIAVKLILVILTIALVAIALFLLRMNTPTDILSQLQSAYGNVETIDATFQGYASQKATVRAGNKTILLQVVRKVEQKVLTDVIAQLENKITEIGKDRMYFDPYKGEWVNYSVPNEFKPLEEEVLLKGTNARYYIVYANEIFSYFIFAQEQAKFRGIVSVFSCKDTVYKIDILSETASFDKAELLVELGKFYCP